MDLVPAEHLSSNGIDAAVARRLAARDG